MKNKNKIFVRISVCNGYIFLSFSLKVNGICFQFEKLSTTDDRLVACSETYYENFQSLSCQQKINDDIV